MFNVIIPHNFDSPYKARNFKEYWQKWHITLSRFLSTYIFRNVYKKGDKWRNYYIATMVTFLVSGFWHGAGWTFVVWGLINGFFVCTASWMDRKGWKFPFLISFTLTALGVVLARVLFVSNTFGEALSVYKGMLNFASLGNSITQICTNTITFITSNLKYVVFLVIGILICWFAPNSKQIMEKFKLTKTTAIISATLMIISLLCMDKVVQFLYFQF